MIQQRLLNTTDQVDESRFSPDLAAALLNDCKTAMNRITTVLIQIKFFCFGKKNYLFFLLLVIRRFRCVRQYSSMFLTFTKCIG
jgi:hypothetical protein